MLTQQVFHMDSVVSGQHTLQNVVHQHQEHLNAASTKLVHNVVMIQLADGVMMAHQLA